MDNSNLSQVSEGQIQGLKEYDNIEKQIRQKNRYKADKQEKKVYKQNQIPNNQQLGEYLAQVQKVSNHNLQVATTYMMQLQQSEQQLQKERESAFRALKEKEDLDRKTSYQISELKEIIEQYKKNNDELTRDNIDLSGRLAIAEETIREKDKIIHENKEFIRQLQKKIINSEQEITELKEKEKVYRDEIDNLTKENTNIRLEVGAFKNLQEQMRQLERTHEKQMDEQKEIIKQKETTVYQEIEKRKAVEQNQLPLQQELEFLKEKLESLQTQHTNLQIQEKLIRGKHERLEETFNEKLKQEVYESQGVNLDRIVILEKQNQVLDQDIFKVKEENTQLAQENQAQKGEIEFYIKEYQNFDLQMGKMKEERSDNLLEFQKLKKKYEKCIEDLQKDLSQNQFNLIQQQEETKNTQMHLDRYVQKVQDMVEMQQIIDKGDKYFAEKVKGQALEEHVRTLAAKQYDNRTQQIQEDLDEYIKKDIEEKKEQFVDREDELDNEWDDLYKNIQSVDLNIQSSQQQLENMKNLQRTKLEY